MFYVLSSPSFWSCLWGRVVSRCRERGCTRAGSQSGFLQIWQENCPVWDRNKTVKKKQTKIIPSSWSTFSFFFGLFVSVWKAQWKGAITFLMWWTVFPLRIFYQQLINCATLVFWHTRREMRGEKEKKGNQSLWWVQWELTRIQTHRRYTIGVCCCSRSNS